MVGFEIGSIIDERYEILSVLGKGGMGCVYKARQLNLDRTVAIKVPSQQVLESVEYRKRFTREAHLCAKISHPHVVSIFDVHDGPPPYIVMALVDGLPLNEFLIEEYTTIFVSDLIEIIRQICQGLDAAHAQGIIHRDIKPANIVITRDTQQVKIMDFGIARASDNTMLTLDNTMMGTPYYMAPEQIRGEKVSPATDLYALGCIVYSLFTGKHVFRGEIATLLYRHTSVLPVPPGRHNTMLPPEIDGVILRALDKDPAKRQDSAIEFQRELRKSLRPLTHLPYSQIFPKSLKSNSAKKRASAARKPRPKPPPDSGAFNQTLPIAATTSARENQDSSQSQPTPAPESLDATGPLPMSVSDIERAETQESEATEADKKNSASVFLIIAGLLFALGLMVGAFYLIPIFLDKSPEEIAPQSKHSLPPAPTPTPRPTPSETPSHIEPTREIILSWLVKDEEKEYALGDWLTLRWKASPQAASSSPHLYQVELIETNTKRRVEKKITQYQHAAFRVNKAGTYTLSVTLQSTPQFKATGPIERTIKVADRLKEGKGP